LDFGNIKQNPNPKSNYSDNRKVNQIKSLGDNRIRPINTIVKR